MLSETQTQTKTSQTVHYADDCDTKTVACGECGAPVCPECSWERIHPESDEAQCGACCAKEARYWRGYFGASVQTHRNACESLDIPSSSSDAEVMEAARGLK